MKTRILTVAAAALWATAITMSAFAFTVRDTEGMFETANIVALAACVPTFYLMAEALFERHFTKVERDHEQLLLAISRLVERSGAERDLPRVHRR